jgi:DNA-binding transcriptional LysR family regulator
MDLRQLEMFRAIVETGSFTEAGKKLYVSQSAISRQVKLLEEELGDELFRRVHRKVILTTTGEILLRHADRIFNEIRLLNSHVSDATNFRRGRLYLAGGMSVCTYLFPPLLKEYRKRHPNVDLRIATGTTEEILRMLKNSDVDIAFLSLPFEDPDLDIRHAQREEMVLVMDRNHPLVNCEQISFSDLTPYTFIHFEKGSNTRKLLEGVFANEGIDFQKTMELQNVEITKPLVEKGLGISFVPYPSVAGERTSPGIIYRRVGSKPIFRELGWVFMKSDYLPKPVEQLLSLFEEMKNTFIPIAPSELD